MTQDGTHINVNPRLGPKVKGFIGDKQTSRRAVLRGLSVGMMGAVGLSSSACTTTNPDSGNVNSRGDVVLPDYIPYTALKPDAPAVENGTSPYFAKYPSAPPSFGPALAKTSETVAAMTIMNAIPPKPESNPWWRAINDLLGVNFTMTGAVAGQYLSKFQTTVAGGDLPDLMTVFPTDTPAIPGLLKAKFQDLGEYLAGDAIKAYAGLANIPSYAWRSTVFNGTISLIPLHRHSVIRIYIVRADILRKTGLDSQPSSGEEFMEMLRALTNKSQNQWATASIRGLRDMALGMTGTPNIWRVVDGKFTSYYGTDEFKEGLDVVSRIWKEGLVHPDAFTPNISTQLTGLYSSGRCPFLPATAGWAQLATAARADNPNAETTWLNAPKWDGGGLANNWLNAGSPYYVGLKKASPTRIRRLLEVVNMLAAPWGTAENILIKNGVKGHDYTVKGDGSYEITDRGKAENMMPIQYSGAPALVHYASDPEIGRAEYEAEKSAMDRPEPHPTVGLDSPTDQSKGASLNAMMRAMEDDIIQGRKPLSEWDHAYQNWLSTGGQQIQAEYEKSYQDVNS